MDNFQLFEKVTGRVSLKTGKVLETALKEACRETGAQYHEAADEILITGTWEQVSATQTNITRRILDSRGESSSSSDYSEGVTSKPGRTSFNTSPPVAKYVKSFHGDDLKNIEQSCKVKITWSKDYTTVQIKAQSVTNYNDDLFNSACDQFADLYRQLHQNVDKTTFNVSQDVTDYNSKDLENAVSTVPRIVPCIILDRSADGSEYTLWGKTPSLSQAKQWIREKLGIATNRTRTVSPKGPPKHALSHETGNQLKVVVYEGNITRENADVIVNACNKHLDHAGGVSYAISKAGGPNVQKESDDFVKKNGTLKTGEVAITGAGFLHSKSIVHAVGPQWKIHGKERCVKVFSQVFMNIYEAAVKLGAKSIAMPAISSGIYGVPKEVCAQAAFSFVDEIDQILASDPTARPFEIRLVNIDGEIAKTFSQEYTKWLFKGRKVERRHSFNEKRKVRETPVERKSVDDMHKTPRMKVSLFTGPKIPQSSAQDDRSLDGTPAKSSAQRAFTGTSGIKYGSTGTSGTSTVKFRISGTPAFSVASSSKVKVTTGASTSPSNTSPAEPPSSSSIGATTNQSKFNSASLYTRTSTTSSPSQYGSVLNAGQSEAGGKHGKSGLTTTVRYDQNGSHSSGKDLSDCSICRCPCTDPVSLSKCGHTFCKSCIDRAFTYQKKCPICLEVYGVSEGDQPEGTMDVKSYSLSLPGYEGCGCYLIIYVIPDGCQDSRHPKPGKKFTGTKRQAFLPATKEGNVVLKLLQKAFEKKLVFTVGQSNTTGQEDCVVWNDIHHKTSIDGGPQNFGYPDPSYLSRVKDELKAKGIVPE